MNISKNHILSESQPLMIYCSRLPFTYPIQQQGTIQLYCTRAASETWITSNIM